VITHLADEHEYDEIQTIFYTANEFAAGMASTNISKFLVDKEKLRDLLLDIFRKKAVVTLESIVTQILLKAVQKEDCISFKLVNLDGSESSLYNKRESYNDPLRPKFEKKDGKQAKLQRLYEIYNGKKADKISQLKNIKFTMPMISMNFDCITNEKDLDKTILRISVYDKCDNPFTSASEILERIYNKDLNNTIKTLADSRSDFKKGSINREQFEKDAKEQINFLINKKILEKDNGDYKLKPNLSKRGNSAKDSLIKDVYKEIYPSLTFGSQNTALISANVSTINDSKLSTIFITRPERNNLSEINDRVYSDLPLTVLPTQASVEIIGCPWVNFGQHLFLDFETGTTIDNKYTVTGITHNFSPGKFTTQLTLSYGDNYGKIDNLTGIVGKALLDLNNKDADVNDIPGLDDINTEQNNDHTFNLDKDYEFDVIQENLATESKTLESFKYSKSFTIPKNSSSVGIYSLMYFYLFKNSFFESQKTYENYDVFLKNINKSLIKNQEINIKLVRQSDVTPKIKKIKGDKPGLIIGTNTTYNFDIIINDVNRVFSNDSNEDYFNLNKFKIYLVLFKKIKKSNKNL
jgi:hypothetical protein